MYVYTYGSHIPRKHILAWQARGPLAALVYEIYGGGSLRDRQENHTVQKVCYTILYSICIYPLNKRTTV